MTLIRSSLVSKVRDMGPALSWPYTVGIVLTVFGPGRFDVSYSEEDLGSGSSGGEIDSARRMGYRLGEVASASGLFLSTPDRSLPVPSKAIFRSEPFLRRLAACEVEWTAPAPSNPSPAAWSPSRLSPASSSEAASAPAVPLRKGNFAIKLPDRLLLWERLALCCSTLDALDDRDLAPSCAGTARPS